MPSRPNHVLPWLFAALLAASWATAQNEASPRPLAQLAPAESFLLLGQTPTNAPETGLQRDLAQLDLPRAGRTLTQLGELSGEPAVRDLLGTYGDLMQGAEGRLERQRLRNQTGPGAGFVRCFEANTSENFETSLANGDNSDYSALLSVGASSYSPIPAVTAMLRVTPEAAAPLAEVQRLIVRCSAQAGAEIVRLREGNTPLIVVGDGSDSPFVLSRVGTLFVAGTNPEAVRGVVRRAHGSAEPNLSETDFYRQNRALLGGPGLSLALDATALGNTLENFGSSFAGAQTQPLLDKAVAALRTLGSYAGAVRFKGQELRLTSRLNVNPGGGDADLAALLLNDTPAPAPTLAPDSSLTVSAAHIEPQAVLAYLEGWADLIGRATGEPVSLGELAQQELGFDLDVALGWLGNELTSIVLEPVGTDVNTFIYGQPQVLALQTTDEAAARAGLAELGGALQRALEAQDFPGMDFSDMDLPSGLSAQTAQSSYTFGDTEIQRLRVGPTSDLGTAFLGDTLLIGRPAAALEDVLTTAQGDRRSLTENENFRQIFGSSPNGVSLVYRDVSAELRGYADLTRAVAQPLAFAASVGLAEEVNKDDLPNFADLLHLAELVPNTLEALARHTETLSSVTRIENGVRRSSTQLKFR